MYSALLIKAGNTVLKHVDKFCYIGCVLSAGANIDDGVGARLAKAVLLSADSTSA